MFALLIVQGVSQSAPCVFLVNNTNALIWNLQDGQHLLWTQNSTNNGIQIFLLLQKGVVICGGLPLLEGLSRETAWNLLESLMDASDNSRKYSDLLLTGLWPEFTNHCFPTQKAHGNYWFYGFCITNLFPLFILLFVQINKALPVQFSLVHSREFDQVKHEVKNNPSKTNVLNRVLPTQRPLGQH